MKCLRQKVIEEKKFLDSAADFGGKVSFFGFQTYSEILVTISDQHLVRSMSKPTKCKGFN